MDFRRTFTRSTIAAATLFALSLPVAANEASSARSDATGAQSAHPPVSTHYGTSSSALPGSHTDSASSSIGMNQGQASGTVHQDQARTSPGSDSSAPSQSAQAQVTLPERDLGMAGRSAHDSRDRLAGGDRLADNAQVREVQQKLKSEGHDPGPIDGIKGPRTEAALKSFQQAKGIEASGEIDQQTLAALNLEGQPSTSASLAGPARMNDAQTSASPSMGTSTDSPQSQARTSLGTSTDSPQSQASTSMGTSTDSPQSQASTSAGGSQAGAQPAGGGQAGSSGGAS